MTDNLPWSKAEEPLQPSFSSCRIRVSPKKNLTFRWDTEISTYRLPRGRDLLTLEDHFVVD
jgi:hypothetical protein